MKISIKLSFALAVLSTCALQAYGYSGTPKASGAAPSGHASPAAAASPAAPAAHAAEAPRVAPDQILAMLSEGNTRFVDGKMEHPNADSWRRQTTFTEGQHPLVTVLACSDSREPPELIFDRGIGDLFVIRVAGNVVDKDEIATAEYGCGHLNTPLLMVLGHTKCGAVAACVGNAQVHGSLPHLLSHINPAEKAAREKHPGARDDEIVRMTVVENVWNSLSELLTGSAELRELALEGKLRVVGALYDIQTGQVKILGRHPNEKNLLLTAAPEGGQEEGKPAPAHH